MDGVVIQGGVDWVQAYVLAQEEDTEELIIRSIYNNGQGPTGGSGRSGLTPNPYQAYMIVGIDIDDQWVDALANFYQDLFDHEVPGRLLSLVQSAFERYDLFQMEAVTY